jgi:hypothetical protein
LLKPPPRQAECDGRAGPSQRRYFLASSLSKRRGVSELADANTPPRCRLSPESKTPDGSAQRDRGLSIPQGKNRERVPKKPYTVECAPPHRPSRQPLGNRAPMRNSSYSLLRDRERLQLEPASCRQRSNISVRLLRSTRESRTRYHPQLLLVPSSVQYNPSSPSSFLTSTSKSITPLLGEQG